MSDFKTYSSDEINQAKTDERLLEEIIENFSPYIRKLSRKYSKINRLNDYDDLINVGYFAVYYAVNNYKSELGYAFSTYCMENIKLRILNSARNRSKKDKQDFKTKSLNVLVGAENGREDYLENLIESHYPTQDKLYEENETNNLLWQKAKEVLTDKQFSTLWEHFKNNKTYREISEEENVSYQCIGKRVDSSCNQLRKVLDINDFI